MMTRCHMKLNAFLIAFLISSPVYSGSIEVTQWIPWKILIERIEGARYESRSQQDEYLLQVGEFNPKLYDLEFSISGSNPVISINENGLDLELFIGGSLSVSKIVIDQLITREFNGNIIQVHVKADCSGPAISIRKLAGQGKFHFIKVKNRWHPEIKTVNLTLNPSDWDMSQITCQGIGGIGEELTKQIQEALRNPNSFSELMKTSIKEIVDVNLSKAWDEITKSASQDLMVKEMLKPDSKGISLIGEIKIASSRVEKMPSIRSELLSDNSPQLILSNKGFEALLEDQYFSISSKKKNLQEFAGFRELMSSKVAQFFVWPDLRRFPSNNPFYLSMIPSESRLILKQENADSWNAQINSNGRVSTLIGGSEIEYLYLGVTYSTSFSVDVNNGEMKLQNSSANLSLAWSYGFLYQLLYKPNPKISTKILKNAVQDSLSNQTITRKLPILNIDDKEWILQNWKQENDFITMDWQ